MPGPWEKYQAQPETGPVAYLGAFIPPAPERVARQQREQARQAASDARETERLRLAQLAEVRAAAAFKDAHPDPLPVADPAITGPDFLKTLAATDAAQVRALAEGRLQIPQGRAATSPYWQTKIQQVSQYDPQFDAVNYNARAATRRDFTSGKGANNIRALNTAIGHLAHLADQISGTASHGGFPGATTVNAAQNAIARSSGDAGVTQFEQTAGALAGELTQVYRASGGAEADIQRYLKELDPNGSADQKKAAVANIMSLLQSRLDALGDQYNKGMGIAAGGLQPLDDRSKKALTKYLPGFNPAQYGGMGGSGSDPGGGATPPSAPPAPVAASGDFRTERSARLSSMIDTMISSGATKAQIDSKLQAMDYPPLRDDQWADVQNWRKSNPGKAYAGGDAVRQVPLTAMQRFAGSAPGAFIAKAADTFTLGAPTALAGAQGKGALDAMSALHPDASELGTAAGIAGQMAAGFGMGKALPGLANFAGTLPGAMTTGGVVGATEGGLRNTDSPVTGMVEGGLGGILGGAVGQKVLGPLANRLMRTAPGQALSNTVRAGANKIVPGSLAPTAGLPAMSAADAVLAKFSPELQSATQNLDDAARLNLPYSLADSDPKLRLLGGTVARKSPDARVLAENTFGPRGLGQADRAVNAIDTHLAPITDIEQRGRDLLAAGDQAAGPSYNMAFDRPGPVDPEIGAMLNTPAGQASLAHARTIAANKGLDPNKMGFDLNDQGNVVLKSVPSFETLQLVKRGMDAHLNSFADPFGNLNLRGNPMAQSVMDLKSRFNSKLADLNPNYAEGNRIWSGYAQRNDALNLGHDILPKNSTPFRQFEAAHANLTPETLPEAQRGYATALADQVDRVRMANDPYETIYGSPNQQAKIGAMFPEGADNFGRTYGLEKDMAATRYETMGGSPTAARMQADSSLGGDLGSAGVDAAAMLAGGGFSPSSFIKLGSRFIGDSAKLGIGKKAEQRAGALAPILYNTDPQAARDMLMELANKQLLLGQRARMFNRGGAVVGALALPSFGVGQ